MRLMERSRFAGIALIFAAIVVLGIGSAHAGISLEFAGQWGGPCNAAVVAGDRAYLGMGRNVVVLDVSNKTAPVELGKLLLASGITAVAVSGDLAYVTTSASELHVIDVSNPQHPAHAGQSGTIGAPVGITVSGGYAYIATGATGLRVFDLSVPENPVLVGNCDTIGMLSDIAISDHYAYVADGASGLQVIDIADPANPVAIGGYDTTGYATGVTISGHYAYVADGSPGLRVIDVANPAQPVQVGTYNTSGEAQRVAVSGSYAYVADWTAGLQVINITNPAAPTRAGGYDTSGYAVQIAVSGSYAFIADQGPGLQIINVSSPSSPARVGGYDQGGYAYGLAISGGYAYVGAGGLQVIDVSDPTDLVRSGRCESAWILKDIAISGRYACAASDTGGLRMFDISNPAAPSFVGYWYQNPTSTVAVSGKYAYCNNGPGVAQTINISVPAQPTPVANAYIGINGLNRVTLSGEELYVANGTDGLKVLSVADPNHPTVIGSCDTAGTAYDLALAGGYAYIADFDRGLAVMNVDNPAAPVYMGGLSMSGTVTAIAACGNYAFMPTYAAGLQVFDVSSPASPALAGNYAPFRTGRMVITNNYLYSAGGSDGLLIFRIIHTAWSGFAGRVTDILGNPIFGAMVSTDSGGYTATTDADGNYSMPTILPGRYHLTASKANMLPSTSSVSVVEGQTETCHFTLQTGGTISGYVRDNLGNPVGGVTVAQYPYLSQTDSTGWYALTTLPEGTYSLTASKISWTSVTNSGVVAENDQTTTSNFTLQRGTITGTVTSSGGVPLSGVTISTTVGGYSTTTGDSGTYSISDVMPGGYSIIASKDGWLPQTKSISVTGGQTTASNFTLTAAGVVSGFVTDSAGLPISGASLTTTYSHNTYTATSDSTGHYRMSNMVAGAGVSLICSKVGYATVMKKVNVSAGVETVCNLCLADAIELDLVSSTSISNVLDRIAVSNGIAVVQSGTGLQFVNVSDPVGPVKLSTFGTASDVEVAGDYAYVANGATGLEILNISNPSAPSLVGAYDTTGSARAVRVVGNSAYVADDLSGLQIINVTNPAAPTRVGGYNTSGNACGVDVAGGYACVADGSGGLQVIDVRNPANPTLAGHYSVSNCAFNDVAISGNNAYITDGYQGLFQVVNISVPANPVLVGTGYTGYGDPLKVSISGNYAYVGAGSGGVAVYDITSPTDPGLVAQYHGCTGMDVAISNGYVYVADSSGKLVILTPSYLKITGIAPRYAANSESALLASLTGLGFDAGAAIKLTRSGQADINATEVSVVDAAHITCTFNLTGAAPGFWDVVVTETGGLSSCLAGGLAVVLPDSTPCVAMVNRNITDAIMTTACGRWRVRLYGHVTQTTSDSLWISDGSGSSVRVYAPDYSHTRIITGDYVAATGSLDLSSDTAVLMSTDADIDSLH